MTVDEAIIENLCQEERESDAATVMTDLSITRGLLLRLLSQAEGISGLDSPEAQWLVEKIHEIAMSSHDELASTWAEKS